MGSFDLCLDVLMAGGVAAPVWFLGCPGGYAGGGGRPVGGNMAGATLAEIFEVALELEPAVELDGCVVFQPGNDDDRALNTEDKAVELKAGPLEEVVVRRVEELPVMRVWLVLFHSGAVVVAAGGFWDASPFPPRVTEIAIGGTASEYDGTEICGADATGSGCEVVVVVFIVVGSLVEGVSDDVVVLTRGKARVRSCFLRTSVRKRC